MFELFYGRQFFAPEGESGGGATPPADPPQTPPADSPTPVDPPDLGDAGKAALQRERDARKAAEKAAKEAAEKLAAIEAERQRAAEEKAKEQVEWQRLAEEREKRIAEIEAEKQAEIDRLKAETAERDRRDWANAACRKHGLDESLSTRLQGSTEDELNKDAEALAKLVKSAAPTTSGNPATPPGTPGKSAAEADKEALERQRRLTVKSF